MISGTERMMKRLTAGATVAFAAALACLLLGLAGCATTTTSTRSHLASMSDKLEHNADAMAVDTRSADYPSAYVHDVHVLADDAREFRHTVEDRSATDADVRVAFERLSRSFHAVRDEAEHSDSRTAHNDLQAVSDSYMDVEHEMASYSDHAERRASADY